MIGKECICPLQAKHSDWCSLAGIVQAIVETFPKNCALMFPPPLPLVAALTFSSTFKLDLFDDDDDNDNMFGASSSFCRFESSLPTPSSGVHGGFGGKGCSSTYTSTSLLRGGAFTLASNPKGVPSSSLGMAPAEDEEPGSQPGDDDLDMALEADDEGEGEKDPASDEPSPDPAEVELLLHTINPVIDNQPPPAPKSGDKRGSTHLDGDSGSSESSGEDLDAKGACPKKKVSTPNKASVSHPSQWTEDDIDVVHQIRYKTDFGRFQNYHQNKIDPADISSINTKDHSTYIKVAWADPGSVIGKSIFSVAAYREVLRQKGGNVSRFDKEVGTKFKKGLKGSWAPDSTKVAIDRVMLVCQRDNGVNVT